jgi:membrane protein implicated in regulation of membrane protease activity
MRKISLIVASLCLIAAATPASAYIGPGAGITMLGALWGVIVAIALAIGAVLFYPIRVVLRRFKKPAAGPASTASGERLARDGTIPAGERAAQDPAR